MNSSVFLFFSFVFVTFLQGCRSTNDEHPTASDIAMSWSRCPPPNPRRLDACNASCCSDGSNWDLSCITFVGEATRIANGQTDADILQGYSDNPGKTFGSAITAFASMQKRGRAHVPTQPVEPNSAVFFSIRGFAPGHVAIVSNQATASGDYLVVTTGGPTFGRGIRLVPLADLIKRHNWIYLGWAKL